MLETKETFPPNLLAVTDDGGRRMSIDVRWITLISEATRHKRDLDTGHLPQLKPFGLTIHMYYPPHKPYGDHDRPAVLSLEFDTKEGMQNVHNAIVDHREHLAEQFRKTPT